MTNEICETCLKSIDKKGNYFEVKTYNKGKVATIKYMHTSCHLEREKQKKAMMSTVKDPINMLKGVMRKLGLGEDEVVTIK